MALFTTYTKQHSTKFKEHLKYLSFLDERILITPFSLSIYACLAVLPLDVSLQNNIGRGFEPRNTSGVKISTGVGIKDRK